MESIMQKLFSGQEIQLRSLILERMEPAKFIKWISTKVIPAWGRNIENNPGFIVKSKDGKVSGYVAINNKKGLIEIDDVEEIGEIKEILEWAKSKYDLSELYLEGEKLGDKELRELKLDNPKTEKIGVYPNKLEFTKYQIKTFSRHTPKGLEKYRHQEISDKELKKLSEGEIDDLIDEDSLRAVRNSNKYVGKKLPKYLLTGAGIGAGLGALAGQKGAKVASGLIGAGAGAALALPAAVVRGTSKATEEGHERKKIAKSASRRADKVKGGNSYDRLMRREHQRRQEELEEERNRTLKQHYRKQEQLDEERNAALWNNHYPTNHQYY